MALPADFGILGEDVLAKWLIEDLPKKIQIAKVWPFMGILGDTLKYTNAAAALAEADNLSLDPSETLTDQTVAPTETTYLLGMLETSFTIPYAAQDQFRTPNNLVATYDALAIRHLLYGYFAKIGADPAPTLVADDGQFKCLQDLLATTSNDVDMATGALTLAALDQAYSLVTANDGFPNAIMSTSRAQRTYFDLCYTAGFSPPTIEVECYDPSRGKTYMKVPSLHGTPWYINDLMPDDVTPTIENNSIYIMVLGDDGGSGPTHGITGICPKQLEGNMFVRRETANADTNNNSLKIDWTWPVGLAMGSEGALAAVTGFSLIADV